jgi:hypothetical protein
MRSKLSSDDINDIRTNIIELLVRLFKKYDDQKQEVHLSFEKYQLHYVPKKGLWLDGAVDKVAVRAYLYSAVSLGEKVQTYGHVPYYWLKDLLGNEVVR